MHLSKLNGDCDLDLYIDTDDILWRAISSIHQGYPSA